MRRVLVLVLVLALGAAITFALLPKRGPSPPPGGADEPYTFANLLPTVTPPEAALRPELLADPVLRIASRFEWAKPEILYWTYRHLPEDRERLAQRLIERLEQFATSSPLQAKPLVEALGVLEEPRAIPILLAIAQAPPDYLQTAIRGLGRFRDQPRVADALAKLSSDPQEVVSHAAMQQILESEVLDPDTVADFLGTVEGGSAIPFLQQVATRRFAACADACARHLESPLPRVRQNAILALLALRDPRGLAAATGELASGVASRVLLALTMWRDAQLLPPLDRVRPLVDHPDANIRKYLAQALGPWRADDEGAPGGAGERGGNDDSPDQVEEGVTQLLRRLASDPDPFVKQTAVEQLWRHGRHEAAQEWRERLERGHGGALKEAAQFLCEVLKDPASVPTLRARLDGERLDGVDQANLLFGLRFVGDASDTARFLDRVERAGTAEDRRSGTHSWLSEHASLHLQSLGTGVAAAVAAALDRAATPRARLVLLDTLRGVARGSSPALAEGAFARLVDRNEAMEVRRAAADTVPFFDDAALGTRLFALRDAVGDKELADRITRIFACYF